MDMVSSGLYDACMKAIEDWVITDETLQRFEPFIQHKDALDTLTISRSSLRTELPEFWSDLGNHKYYTLTPYSPILGCGTCLEYIPGFGNKVWWKLRFDGGSYEPMQEDEWLPVTDEFANHVKEVYAEQIKHWESRKLDAYLRCCTDEARTLNWTKTLTTE